MNLDKFEQALAPYLSRNEWLLAYSGGLDSSVLLHLLATIPSRPPLKVIHINHQLNPKSQQWAEFAQRRCEDLSVSCEVVTVAPLAAGKGPEDAARKVRYEEFERRATAASVLLMAHHQDDQAETILLRLLRGAGPTGLAGIPPTRRIGQGCLLRPLLDYSRDQLHAYAQTHGLEWCEDDSNQDISLDRNYLRQQVLPLLQQRWPSYRQSWSDAARIQRGASDQLEQLASADLSEFGMRQEPFGFSLDAARLQRLPPVRARNVLAVACREHDLAAPPRAQVEEVLSSLLAARDDAQPQVHWSGVHARRFSQRVYILSRLPECPTDQTFAVSGSKAGGSQTIQLPGVGSLLLEMQSTDVIRPVNIGFRQAGERVRSGGKQSKSLSNWFQENAVPPWLRERMPLLYVDQQLQAIGDLWRDESAESLIRSVQIEWL